MTKTLIIDEITMNEVGLPGYTQSYDGAFAVTFRDANLIVTYATIVEA